jgi:glycosyltransferase involved in cell wall biosynthesis
MKYKNYNLIIDASRNKSGGAINYIKNFIEHLDISSTKIKKVIIISDKNLLKKIPKKRFLIKHNHPFLEQNILFQIFWQLILLPIFLKKEKNNILYSVDSTSFCKHKLSIVFNQDILSFDKNVLKNMPFGLEKLRLYIIKKVQIYAMNNASKIIFLSKFSRKIIGKYLKKKNNKVIHHGIDRNLISIGKKNFYRPSWDYKKKNTIKLIYVSPLFIYKNQLTVAKAYSKLKNKYKNLEINFIGEYKHNINLFNKIINENPSVSSKNFIGNKKHKEVIDSIANSDIFIFASSSESFGITLLEGMALGLPIVCSNKTSLPEILGQGGIYFNPNNYHELAAQIEKYILDKKLRKIKSKKALSLVCKYNWHSNVKKFCNLVNNLTH